MYEHMCEINVFQFVFTSVGVIKLLFFLFSFFFNILVLHDIDALYLSWSLYDFQPLLKDHRQRQWWLCILQKEDRCWGSNTRLNHHSFHSCVYDPISSYKTNKRLMWDIKLTPISILVAFNQFMLERVHYFVLSTTIDMSSI